MPGGHPGRTRVDTREELRGERRDDQQDRTGAAQAEIAGGQIRPVAQCARGLPDAFRRGLGDPAAPFVAEDQETAAWETPAAWATSRLVGRVPARGIVAPLLRLDW
ncbi:hypothetical protein SHKM778_64880 [Streptomyces sp. KM77-8]|uniref:Uncharacterized protein n=1 Tax=Streptomyces haneummycinicus TaxID=3074435 RepID=A0AAT9HSS1_9ACTN